MSGITKTFVNSLCASIFCYGSNFVTCWRHQWVVHGWLWWEVVYCDVYSPARGHFDMPWTLLTAWNCVLGWHWDIAFISIKQNMPSILTFLRIAWFYYKTWFDTGILTINTFLFFLFIYRQKVSNLLCMCMQEPGKQSYLLDTLSF